MPHTRFVALTSLVLAACGGGSAHDAAPIVPDAEVAFFCPDGEVVCPAGEFCQITAETGEYRCMSNCATARTCGRECCALGTGCVEGRCLLPDLSVDFATLGASAEVVVQDFPSGSCEIGEGCLGSSGVRVLLRFTLRTPNIGQGDLRLGDPTLNPLFDWSDCHEHYHFREYADYRLLDMAGVEVANGHKQGFCLLDGDRFRPDAKPTATYDCGFQGISAGWADSYTSNLPCQWVDVSGVPPGDYQLEVTVNPARVVPEADFANNTATVPVTIPPSTCPDGCTPIDETCCRSDDPCGLAGDGACNCQGLHAWDAADCAVCLSTAPDCPVTNSCAAGCTPPGGACCNVDDSCSLGWNGACDCGGAFWWEWEDCDSCLPVEPACLGWSSCPGGCTPEDGGGCCDPSDPCGLAGDGVCDCGAAQPWDDADCSRCVSKDPDCPAFNSCPGGCLPSDASPCCDWLGDACGRARNGVCDCGDIWWDAEDCAYCSCP